MGTDRAITDDLMVRLRRHYIKPGSGLAGGVFVPECGLNGTGGGGRCDALYVGFTSTSGRLLVGHEVKASRSDWLHELGQLHKADQWADQCHEWWLVTAPGVVRDGELPAGWGHLVPGPSRTRMKIVQKAQRHPDRQPSWLTVRSIIARLDTLQQQAMAQHRVDVHQELQARHQEELERLRAAARPVDPSDERRLRILEEIEAHLGINLDGWRDSDTYVTSHEFKAAVDIVRARRDLTSRWAGLAGSAEELRKHAANLEAIATALSGEPVGLGAGRG